MGGNEVAFHIGTYSLGLNSSTYTREYKHLDLARIRCAMLKVLDIETL
jgi:hypothetical protein